MSASFYRQWGKRTLDVMVSLIALVLAFPIFLTLALLIKSTSAGPVFYWHERIGVGGRRFHVMKFRTMIRGADKLGWNVLNGDMSLVGPRPEVPHYVELYSPAQRRVLAIRPGITDPASIAYRHEEELLTAHPDLDRYYREVILPDKLRLNLAYLDRMSFLYDLSLLLRTTTAIFTSRPYVLHEDH
jgi:lipopolysaccharide/colanic/teichoic acid biosynthesis glycosyltransferase